MKKKTIIIIVSILLVLALGYIGLSYLNERQIQKQILFFQEGQIDGQIQTITMIFELSEDCQIVPMQIYNESKSFVDVSCLNTVENKKE